MHNCKDQVSQFNYNAVPDTFENLKNQGANETKSVFSLPTDFNRSRSDTGFNSGF